MSFGIVIPNRYPELAETLIASILKTEADIPPILVVADRHTTRFDHAVTLVADYPEFVFARNVNMGINSFGGLDIVLINDDVTLIEDNCLQILATDAHRCKDYGIVAPLVDGGIGNPYQSLAFVDRLWKGPSGKPDMIAIPGQEADSMPVCFVCVYLKREMIDQIGLLDERFIHYGFDDNDYCLRARKATWKTVITRSFYVKHGTGGGQLRRGENWSVSFAKTPTESNQDYFLSKYAPKSIYLPPI